jgi:hypothetical protein
MAANIAINVMIIVLCCTLSPELVGVGVTVV